MAGMNESIMAAIPEEFDIFADTNTHTGHWSRIACFNSVTFPSNTTGNKLGTTGKNLSGLNNLVPDGYEISGNWSSITLASGTVIAYRWKDA